MAIVLLLAQIPILCHQLLFLGGARIALELGEVHRTCRVLAVLRNSFFFLVRVACKMTK